MDLEHRRNILAQYARIKKLKHLDYLRETWLPTFIEKYKTEKKKSDNNYNLILAKFVKIYFLPEVINLTEDTIIHIPGVYRKRLLITDEHLKKPHLEFKNDISKPKENIKEQIGISNIDNNVYNNVDMEVNITTILEHSLIEYEKLNENQCEEDMIKAINQSLEDINYDNIDLNSLDDSDDELLAAVMLSLENNINKFYVCIDLNLYGPNPYQPIVIDGKEYFLQKDQISNITLLWEKINEFKYNQKIEYIKAMSVDLDILNKN